MIDMAPVREVFAPWARAQREAERLAHETPPPPEAGAAFCELVGAVTAYVITGDKPALRADLPPAELSTL